MLLNRVILKYIVLRRWAKRHSPAPVHHVYVYVYLVCRTKEISSVLQRSPHLPLPRKHSPEGDTAAQQCRISS